MSKNIQTHNADINLIKKFLDYANCADASYARLEYIHKNIGNDKKADDLTFGNKLNKDIEIKDDEGNLLYTKPKGTNTAYACAIEARFNEGLIVETKQYFCIPFSEVCLGEKEIAINNDITKVGLDFPISARTKIFTNRFRILAHQKNTDSGFSATLFEDTEDNKQKIFAIRGTEPSDWEKDIVDADMDLMFYKLPSNQHIDMIKFYAECIADKHITEFTPLVIVGHSLGGCLAQLLTLSLATSENVNNIKEVYTFNSPAIDGIDNMLMRALAALLDKNIMEQVLNPQKVYCVYDSGGVNIIASAQYGSRNRLPIFTGRNSHSLIPLTQTLYFYSYLLELESIIEILQANNNDISQSLENLNALSNAIHRILEDISFQEATGYGEALQIPPTPHYLYATIDKTLFEATLHTKQKKLQVDITTLIEGMLDLQDKGIFLQLLTKESMQEAATDVALRESNLAILLAIHERLFFISVLQQDNQAQALIQTKDDITTLLKHNTTRAQIFCYNLEHIDEKLMRGYLNDAFRFYPFIDKKKVA